MEPEIKNTDVFGSNEQNIQRNTVHHNEDTIDLLNVLKIMRMKKRYLWLVAAFFLTGIIVSGIVSFLSSRLSSVTGVITYTYKGAENLTAPDGNPLDLGVISSQYLVSRALERTDISSDKKSKITASDISESISVKKLYSENTVKQISNLNLLNGQNKLQSADLAGLQIEYSNRIVVSINNTSGLNKTELTSLLNNLFEVYSEYLAKEYSVINTPTNRLANLNLSDMEYTDIIDDFVLQLNILEAFCSANTSYSDYRLSSNGRSFSDLAALADLIQSEDIVYLEAFIFENGVVRNSGRSLEVYNYQLKNLEYDYNELLKKIETTQALIEEYKNSSDTVINGGTHVDAGISVTDYYNSLVEQQKQNYAEKTALLSKIKHFREMIEKINSNNEVTNRANCEYIESEIDEICNKITEVYQMSLGLVSEIRDNNQDGTALVNVIPAQYDKMSFLTANTVKTIIMYGLIGAFFAVIIWGCRALFIEATNSRMQKTRG